MNERGGILDSFKQDTGQAAAEHIVKEYGSVIACAFSLLISLLIINVYLELR